MAQQRKISFLRHYIENRQKTIRFDKEKSSVKERFWTEHEHFTYVKVSKSSAREGRITLEGFCGRQEKNILHR